MQLVEAFLRNDESHKLCLNSCCRPCSCFSFVLFCRSPINNRTGVLQNAYTHYHDIFDYLIHEIISGRKARDLSIFWLQRPCSCCPFVFSQAQKKSHPPRAFPRSTARTTEEQRLARILHAACVPDAVCVQCCRTCCC